MSPPAVPGVDIAPVRDGTEPEGVVRQVVDARARSGLLVLAGRGVEQALIDRVLADSRLARNVA